MLKERNMNIDTVRKCAEMASSKQQSALGYVDQDILDLLAELNAPAAEETPPAPAPTKAKKAK